MHFGPPHCHHFSCIDHHITISFLSFSSTTSFSSIYYPNPKPGHLISSQHCITFGSPPITLLPLTKPSLPHLRKSLFLSFINEGDPVPRADKPYIRSLLDLYASPAPGQTCLQALTPATLRSRANYPPASPERNGADNPITLTPGASKSNAFLKPINVTQDAATGTALLETQTQTQLPIWHLPTSTLSCAGRLVLLRASSRASPSDGRGKKGGKKKVNDLMDDGVVAQIVTDELLRGYVAGDPVMHVMALYARRVEVLATWAVMGRGG